MDLSEKFFCENMNVSITHDFCLRRQKSKQQYDPCWFGECEQGNEIKAAAPIIPFADVPKKVPMKRSKRQKRGESPYSVHFQAPAKVLPEKKPEIHAKKPEPDFFGLSKSEMRILQKLITTGEDRVLAGV